jgi:hypothetical protein
MATLDEKQKKGEHNAKETMPYLHFHENEKRTRQTVVPIGTESTL